MDQYTIIEDCSPYFIRYTHNTANQVVDICNQQLTDIVRTHPFLHVPLDADVATKILQILPPIPTITFRDTRVSLFITKPGYYYRAHKDGVSDRISVNYTVKILDDKCVTSWYDDLSLSKYAIAKNHYKKIPPGTKQMSREVEGFIKRHHIPLKTMTAIPNECILFNTDIFHDFDNRKSLNERVVLTLRPMYPEHIYFDDMKKLMFNL